MPEAGTTEYTVAEATGVGRLRYRYRMLQSVE